MKHEHVWEMNDAHTRVKCSICNKEVPMIDLMISIEARDVKIAELKAENDRLRNAHNNLTGIDVDINTVEKSPIPIYVYRWILSDLETNILRVSYSFEGLYFYGYYRRTNKTEGTRKMYYLERFVPLLTEADDGMWDE